MKKNRAILLTTAVALTLSACNVAKPEDEGSFNYGTFGLIDADTRLFRCETYVPPNWDENSSLITDLIPTNDGVYILYSVSANTYVVKLDHDNFSFSAALQTGESYCGMGEMVPVGTWNDEENFYFEYLTSDGLYLAIENAGESFIQRTVRLPLSAGLPNTLLTYSGSEYPAFWVYANNTLYYEDPFLPDTWNQVTQGSIPGVQFMVGKSDSLEVLLGTSNGIYEVDPFETIFHDLSSLAPNGWALNIVEDGNLVWVYKGDRILKYDRTYLTWTVFADHLATTPDGIDLYIFDMNKGMAVGKSFIYGPYGKKYSKAFGDLETYLFEEPDEWDPLYSELYAFLIGATGAGTLMATNQYQDDVLYIATRYGVMVIFTP